MEIYLVGGAVRDYLLGKEAKDQDFVVVGSSVEEMKALGFAEVGKDFPVFLHPKNGFEYALARKERKLEKGWGFNLDTTLEEDLIRRDLTINALALATNNNIMDTKILWTKNPIDFFHGVDHLKQGKLQHISPHYAEDPLRIIRTARFAAQFNFEVSDETKPFIKDLSPRIKEISQDRVWKEVDKALKKEYLEKFWQVMDECGATKLWFKNSPYKSSFVKNNTNYFENVINSFKEAEPIEVKHFVLDKEKQNFISCSHFVKLGKNYQEWSVEDKVAFIEKTKAIHNSDIATQLLLWNQKQYQLEPSLDAFNDDVLAIKSFNWQEFVSQNKSGELVKEQKKKLLLK